MKRYFLLTLIAFLMVSTIFAKEPRLKTDEEKAKEKEREEKRARELQEYLEELKKNLTELKKYVEENYNKTDSEELKTILGEHILSIFNQTLSITKAKGVSDSKKDLYMKRVFGKFETNEHAGKIIEKVKEIFNDEKGELINEEILFKDQDGYMNFLSIIGQHDNISKKADIMFTSVQTKLNITQDIYVTSTRTGKTTTTVVSVKPEDYTQKDIDLIMSLCKGVVGSAFIDQIKF